jgi:hypothetical protein
VAAAELKPLSVAVIGCGNIADAYGRTLQPWPDFDTAYQPIPYVKEPYRGDCRQVQHSGVTGVAGWWTWPKPSETAVHSGSAAHRASTSLRLSRPSPSVPGFVPSGDHVGVPAAGANGVVQIGGTPHQDRELY